MATATLPRPPATLDRDERERPNLDQGANLAAPSGPVLVAVDDDDNVGSVLQQGCEEARRLGVALRVAYVWSYCRPPDCPHHRRCHRDLGEASRLLNTLLDEHLTEPGPAVERDVLHDDDPASALVELSAGASLLIIGSSSDTPRAEDSLGKTCRVLVGRSRCPVAVVRHHQLSATRVGW
jgi:nucleotide-binding universal stress UspA family protein